MIMVSKVFPARPEADWAKESNKTKVCDCGLFCQSRMIPARLKQLHFDEYLETNFLKISNDIKWYQYWVFVEKKGPWMMETVVVGSDFDIRIYNMFATCGYIGMPGAWHSKVIGICVDSCWQGTDQLNPEALHTEFQTRSEPKQPHQSHQSFGEKRHEWKLHRLPFQVVELHEQDDLQSRKTNTTYCPKPFKNAFPLSSYQRFISKYYKCLFFSLTKTFIHLE